MNSLSWYSAWVSVILICLSVIPLTPCTAQWSSSPGVNTPICTSVGGNITPLVIGDGGGGTITVWIDSHTGSAQIYAQRLGATGVTKWGTFGVQVTSLLDPPADLAIASDGQGGAIIAWKRHQDIYAQRIDAMGSTRWTADGVAISTDGLDNFYLHIVSDGQGGAVMAWGNLQGWNGIRAQRVDAMGTIKWEPNGVLTGVSGESIIGMVSDGAGGTMIMTHPMEPDPCGRPLHVHRVDGAGGTRWRAVICGSDHYKSPGFFANDGVGGAITTWGDVGPCSGPLISQNYVQRIDTSGATKWAACGITAPSITFVNDGQGGAIFTWAENRSGNSDIYVQKVDGTGATKWTTGGVAICSASGDQTVPILVTDGKGGAIVAWKDFRAADGQLYAQRVNANGATNWAANGVPICTASGSRGNHAIVSDGAGGAIVEWVENRSGVWGIYAQNVDINGNLGLYAKSFVVTNTKDDDKEGSLRYALIKANADNSATIVSPHVIDATAVTDTIKLNSALPNISNHTNILGSSTFRLVIKGAGPSSNSVTPGFRILAIDSGYSVSIRSVEIMNGLLGSQDERKGAGIFSRGTLILDDCWIHNNRVDGYDSYGAGIFSDGKATLLDCTVSNNVVHSGYGCGIYNLGEMTLSNCIVQNNSGVYSSSGGGICNNGGSLALTNCKVDGNSAWYGGEGIVSIGGIVSLNGCTVNNNGGKGGGGVYSSGEVYLTSCTVNGNFGYGYGGIYSSGEAYITNCTVSGNRAHTGTGGILGAGAIRITNSTITGNSGEGGGAGISGSVYYLRNSIVARNSPAYPEMTDVSGSTVISQGHNLIGTADGSSGWISTDITGSLSWPLDPMLGPLQDNGGPTQTHALLSCSPAINGGDNSVIGPPLSLSNDQRGFPRLVGSSVDMGSYESSIASCVQPLVSGLMHPNPNAVGVDKQTNVSVVFRPSVNSSTLTGSTIKVYGLVSGFHTGAITYDPATRRATFTPGAGFKSGENVSVTLTTGITGVSGNSMQHPFIWGFTVASAVGSTSFQTSSQINVGSGPHSICAGDFDGDGDIDLAVTNGNTNTVSILRNDGSGTFTQVSTPTVGSSPRTVIAADVDGDGDLDLVVANNGSNTLSILKNNGSGTFTQTSAPSVGSGPYVVTAGDFDGDGDIDLAVVNYNGNTVSILKNNGSGTFSVTSTLAVGTNPYSLTAGDFDNDGMLDLAVVNEGSNNVYIYKNDGTGSFTYVSTVAVGIKPCSIAAGDFDGDGSLDLAVANYGSNTVSILKNSGSGAFTIVPAVSVGASPRFVNVEDLDGDGHLDLAVVNQGANTVSIVKNDGSGNFSQVSTPSVGAVPKTLVAAGLFGDGRLGLAVANSGANTISILRNTAAPNTVSVTLPDTIVTSSKTVELPIYVSDVTGMNILSYQLTVTFNSPNSILTASSDLVTAGTLSGASGWSALPNISVPNQITVGAFGATPLSGGGVLLRLKFAVSPGTPTGQYSNLQFSNFIFNTGTPAATTANGKITARLLVCGDADENGSVQAYDAALALREAIGPMPPPPPPLTAQGRMNADVDMNGYVQAYDAALILRNVIGLSMPAGVSTCFSGLPKSVALESSPVNFNASVASVQRHKSRTSAQLKFTGVTPDAGIVAISFDVAMAEGADNSTSLIVSGLTEDYMHTINRVDNEHFKVGIINPHGITTDDIRMTIGATREESLKDIRITNILLNSTPAADISLAGTVATLISTAYDLVGCYPNPFNPSTTIRYGIPVDATVNLAVYNTLGQKVAQLVEEHMSAGYHDIVFDASQLASGIYFYRLQAADFVATKKLVLMR